MKRKAVTNYLIILCLSIIQSNIYGQSKLFDPDSILVGNRKQPSVFLVGSFHFAYYNLDAHKTKKEDQVDVLSKKQQVEIEELVDYIAKFKPSKIAVEGGRNSGYLMHRYREYKAGKRKLGKDEIEQIGFRLMDRFHLDTIYGVNDGTLLHSLYHTKDSLTFRPVLDSIFKDWDFRSDDAISKKYSEYYKFNDKLRKRYSLLTAFKYMNSEKVLNRGYGAYLNGDFKLGDTRGADALALHWYSRNLRILRHIQQITTSPNDRILVLFGAGHMGILDHLFRCTPEYNYIKFNELE